MPHLNTTQRNPGLTHIPFKYKSTCSKSYERERGDDDSSHVCTCFPHVSKVDQTDWFHQNPQRQCETVEWALSGQSGQVYSKPDSVSRLHEWSWVKCTLLWFCFLFFKVGETISAKPSFRGLLGEERRWCMWKHAGKKPTATEYPATGSCLTMMSLEPPVPSDTLIMQPETHCPCHLNCLSLGDRNYFSAGVFGVRSADSPTIAGLDLLNHVFGAGTNRMVSRGFSVSKIYNFNGSTGERSISGIGVKRCLPVS